MSKTLKTTLFVVGGLIGLLAFVAVALLLFVEADAYRPRLEAAASKALGMEVRIDGGVGINLFPSLHITLADVHIGEQGAEVATVKEGRLWIDLFPLLRKNVRFRTISLKHPRLSVERDRNGKFNFERPETAHGALLTLGLSKVSLSQGTLLYVDKQSGAGFEARACSLYVHPLRLSRGDNSSDLMKNLSFTAVLACGEIGKNDLTVSDLEVTANGKNGVVDLKPVTMGIFGAQGSGSIRADFSGSLPLYSVRYSLSQFQVEEFFKTLSPQKVAEGSMDFTANLSMRGETVKEIRRSVEGKLSLRGENLKLNGRDLDGEFSRFESSQSFNLVDVGAFFFAGPLGLIVTKGYNFGSILQGPGGSSQIRTLVSDWQVERGMAQAQDVALATGEHRVALQGGVDFVNETFNDLTVALIDAKGCVQVRQSVRGSFQAPIVEQHSLLKSLTGAVSELYHKGRDLFPGGECEVFYSGSVAPPK